MATVYFIIILLFSVIIHEVSHGFMADYLGDPTARLHGRLTLNPLKHIDPIGSIVVPIITAIVGIPFGWAKPVPFNPYNLKDKRVGELLIALAGPASNILLAVIFGLAVRFISVQSQTASIFVGLLTYIVLINIVLAVFNLIPIPPLDGSKVLLSLLPHQYGRFRMMLERFGPGFIFIFIIFGWKLITPIVMAIFGLITGQAIG